jgi:hypothetical protein
LEAPENYKISDLKNKIYYVFLKKRVLYPARQWQFIEAVYSLVGIFEMVVYNLQLPPKNLCEF